MHEGTALIDNTVQMAMALSTVEDDDLVKEQLKILAGMTTGEIAHPSRTLTGSAAPLS